MVMMSAIPSSVFSFAFFLKVPLLGRVLLKAQANAVKVNTEKLMRYNFAHLPGTLNPNDYLRRSELRDGVSENVKDSTLSFEPELKLKGFVFNGFDSYRDAYESGKVTAVQVCKRLIAAVIESNKGEKAINAIINLDSLDLLRQGEESDRRRKEGKTLSECKCFFFLLSVVCVLVE